MSIDPGSLPEDSGVAPKRVENSPSVLPGYTAFTYRTFDDKELRLFMLKPKGGNPSWRRGGKSPCLVVFSSAGWDLGTPKTSEIWLKKPSKLGFVCVLPDFRNKDRFAGSPEDCDSDARAAVHWVEDHAYELGIDPAKIVCLGVDAGGQMVEWVALRGNGPGKDDPGPPEIPPKGLILINPVTDTKPGSGYGGSAKFGGSAERAAAASVTDRISSNMPPTLIFHARGDEEVRYENSKEFEEKLVSNGNTSDLVTFENLGHSYYSPKFGAPGRKALSTTTAQIGAFLVKLGLVNASDVKAAENDDDEEDDGGGE